MFSSSSSSGTGCRECNRYADPHSAIKPGTPCPHTCGCGEPVFAFKSSCPGCRQFHDEEVARNIAEHLGKPAPEPGAPLAHTCDKFGSY